ncbi:MAG: GDP-L-fucose synthase [Chlamydiia bacterium]|nr:GDP-L-fucose synthase [Chlamydiia bacterium]
MSEYLKPFDTILIAGGHGMVGSAIVRTLKANGYHNLLVPSRKELDLTDQRAVRLYYENQHPDVVVIAAAKVGGIYANMTYPADFLYDNLIIECNLIHESHRVGIDRLLFLGSTCIYPKFAPQPIPEEALLTGMLEPTNEGYALAKIAGVKLAALYRKQYGHNYISAMPTNLYGPGDHYHPENAHVIPALIRRFHEAKERNQQEVAMWGTGKVYREFLHVDDLARGCLFLLEKYSDSLHVNIGSNEEITIADLAKLIAKTVGYKGRIINDLSKPDGTPRKKSDISRITALGWAPKISLTEGLQMSYKDFLQKIPHFAIA